MRVGPVAITAAEGHTHGTADRGIEPASPLEFARASYGYLFLRTAFHNIYGPNPFTSQTPKPSVLRVARAGGSR
jgi:hypothetical protein